MNDSNATLTDKLRENCHPECVSNGVVPCGVCALHLEAADEIERLQTEKAELHALYGATIKQQDAEIERRVLAAEYSESDESQRARFRKMVEHAYKMANDPNYSMGAVIDDCEDGYFPGDVANYACSGRRAAPCQVCETVGLGSQMRQATPRSIPGAFQPTRIRLHW